MLASGERRDPRHRPDHGQPALAASVGDAKDVKDGRQFAAWLGVSKRGDGYLGKLLVHGARAVIRVSGKKAGHDMVARQARPWRGQPIQGKGHQSPRD